MAKNDIILVDGILDQRISEKLPSDRRDEVFEYLVLEESLKQYDLTTEEIETGWIDGNGDGGIDGFYTLVNGHLLDDVADFAWPRANAAIDVWLFTCKHHATFQQATLDAVIATIQELFDFSLEDCELKGTYSEDLLESRGLLMSAYRRLSIGRPTVTINVVYASRGDSENVGESVKARAEQIESTLRNFFSSSIVTFRFIGASEIVESHRKVKAFSLDLPFLEHLATGKESYVLLVRLHDFWKFVSDDAGNLRRYLFDSNVRDYLGTSSVNQDIAQSLADVDAPDFWWLNNGVTILATNATIPGKTIQLQDIQIVNGLQTTETIFKHFKEGSIVSADRALLVKIIVATDSFSRDRIIRATNNQSPVETAALHATDKIQRDIEQILERHDWYYERRKNYYKNIGKPPARFVTPSYVASAVVALVFKNIMSATRIKTKFMRNQVSYDDVFCAELPLKVWPILVGVYKRVDAALFGLVEKRKKREPLIGNWRPLLSLMVLARFFKTFAFTIQDLAEMSLETLSDESIQDALAIATNPRFSLSYRGKVKTGPLQACCQELCSKFGVSGLEVIGKRNIKTGIPLSEPKSPQVSVPAMLPKEFIDSVDGLLPNQPWKPGVHLEIATQLACSKKEVSDAIQLLIASGRRHRQKDGVVFDQNGAILSTDPDRVGTDATEEKQTN